MMRRFWSLRTALTVSLAVNVFFVFLVATRVWRHRHMHMEHGGKVVWFFERVPRELSKEDARKFETALEPHRAVLMAEESELKEARQKVVDVLRTEPFDPQAFRRAVEAARVRRASFENDFLKSFIEAAERISAEGRSRLSKLRVHPG